MVDEYCHHDVAVYAGYLNDKKKLLESSSGGVATAMAEYMIEHGGYVAGVAYSKDYYEAEYILSNEKNDIAKLKGSKYISSRKKDIYPQIKRLLDEGKRVLFFGLPCSVAALYKFLGTRSKNLITCELICQGPTGSEVHRQYVEHLESKFRGKIVDFSVRHKKDSWKEINLYALFDNGKVFIKPFYDTEYGYAFSVYGKEGCYHCRFKGNNRCADIMIGDFWGASAADIFYNELGVSSIFAETDKGNDFIKSIKGISLFPTTFEKAVKSNPMVVESRKIDQSREVFLNLLSAKGLIYAANYSVSWAARIKRSLKGIIPSFLKPVIKKLYQIVIGRHKSRLH